MYNARDNNARDVTLGWIRIANYKIWNRGQQEIHDVSDNPNPRNYNLESRKSNIYNERGKDKRQLDSLTFQEHSHITLIREKFIIFINCYLILFFFSVFNIFFQKRIFIHIKDYFDEIIKHKSILFLRFQVHINLVSSYHTLLFQMLKS
jgi:hypothetical protein